MLAGTVYFYNKDKKIIKKMDVNDYDDLRKEEVHEIIQYLNAEKVTLLGFYHNHHYGHETVLYNKYKDL